MSISNFNMAFPGARVSDQDDYELHHASESSPLTPGSSFSRKRNNSALQDRETYSDEESDQVEPGKRFKFPTSRRLDCEENEGFDYNTLNHRKIQEAGVICELCQAPFSNTANLKQHIDVFHMKKSMWQCSECKKLFSSKSNLKVHLRVHTRIKPYHCKSCSYSCMHHSSIKEHLAKIHPNIVHSATNPGYAFNSVVVPDPEQFNSAKFNREAFIAEAKVSNEKLIAQMTNIYHRDESASASKSKRLHANNNSITISPISTSSTGSSSSSKKNSICNSRINTDNDEENSFEQNDSVNTNTSSASSSSVSSPLLNESGKRHAENPMYSSPTMTNSVIDSSQSMSTKSLNFSITSLMNKSPSSLDPTAQFESTADKQWNPQLALSALATSLFQKAPMSLYQSYPLGSAANAWSYANQIQFFYNYFSQMRQPNPANK